MINVDLYANVFIVLTCLGLGKVIKSAPIMSKIENNLIPFLLIVFGVIMSLALNWGGDNVTIANNIGTGIISAAVAIGMHQSGKTLFVSNNKLGIEESEDAEEEK